MSSSDRLAVVHRELRAIDLAGVIGDEAQGAWVGGGQRSRLLCADAPSGPHNDGDLAVKFTHRFIHGHAYDANPGPNAGGPATLNSRGGDALLRSKPLDEPAEE
jgi:hypothetical protein